jgi:hypothetical protein
MLAVAAGALLVGVLLALWGRTLGRIFLGLLAAAGGVAIGPAIAQRIGATTWVVQVSAAISFAILAAILARALWALLAAGIFAAGGLVVLAFRLGSALPKTAGPTSAPSDLAGAYQEYFRQLGEYFNSMWSNHSMSMMLVIGLAGGIPLVIGLIRPRLVAIFMTACIGGSMIAGGLWLAAYVLAEPLRPTLRSYSFIFGASAGGLAILSMVCQYRWALASDRKPSHRQAEPPEKM